MDQILEQLGKLDLLDMHPKLWLCIQVHVIQVIVCVHI